MQKCLTFSPKKRLTVEQALEHPYLEVSLAASVTIDEVMLMTDSTLSSQPYHDPQDEPSADPLPAHFFDFDHVPEQLSRGKLKGEFRQATVHRLQEL